MMFVSLEVVGMVSTGETINDETEFYSYSHLLGNYYWLLLLNTTQ